MGVKSDSFDNSFYQEFLNNSYYTSCMHAGLCPSGADSVIECQGSRCPGGSFCNYNRTLLRFACAAQCCDDPNRDPYTCLGRLWHVTATTLDAI